MAGATAGDGTVGKALDVLDKVAAFGRPVRFSELLAGSPYPKATLYRLLQTLTHQGMLSYDPERHTYAPGVRLVRLAHAAWSQSSLAPVARPYLDALSREVGETVHLAQLDHGQVLYVDKRKRQGPHRRCSARPARSARPIARASARRCSPFSTRTNLRGCSPRQSFHRFTGKTLTSAEALREELGRIRARGYAFDDEEHERGIICIAVPILTRSGRVLGALA